ncbi:MAG TPA: hypothetical protein VFF29_04110 [Bacteroidota bacterium]|nr:hypothetical protein [Bacteroidota bacterium]
MALVVPYPSAMKHCWFIISAFLFISCATSGGFYSTVDGNISDGKYEEALKTVRENRSWYGDKSSVLFNFDMGLLYHYAGEHDSSLAYFFAAEKEIDDLYTKSISQEVLSFMINDNILPYEGEDFEKVLVNIFLALNYAEEGMIEDALVEARKVDLKLREYAHQYDDKNKYQEDAFIRYIAGVLYETGGEINDAFISYKKSFEAYKTYENEYGTKAPSFLLDDLVRTGMLMEFTDEVEQYRGMGGRWEAHEGLTEGNILVIVYTGKGPAKQEIKKTVTIPDTSGVLHTFQIALPEFQPRYQKPRSYDVHIVAADDSITAATTCAENITAIAQRVLEDRLGLIYLKSGGRAVLKFLAAEKIKGEMKKDDKNKVKNFLGSLAVDLVVGATEQADTRSWRTLPSEIQLVKLSLKPGDYLLNVKASDAGYSLREVSMKVQRGKTSFVIVDDVR